MRRLLWTEIFILSVITISTEWALAQAVKIMPLGDSITLGDKSTSTNGYRLTVANLFSSAGLPFDLVGSLKNGTIPDNDHEGHGGWTSGQILDAVNGFLANANPNVVFLHIGTNDLANTTPDEVVTNIGSIVDLINGFNPDIEIYLAKLIPRNDSKNAATDALNNLIAGLVNSKFSNGVTIYLVDQNQAFINNPNWSTAYMFDTVHPNDAGYAVMGQTWYNTFNQYSRYTAPAFTDDFNRTTLGSDWVTHPDISILNNELHNNALVADWNDASNNGYIALVKTVTKANSISFTYGSAATTEGIAGIGAATMFDAPSITASGYMINKYTPSGQLRLWEVKNGVAQFPNLASVPYNVDSFGPGDRFRVEISTDNTGHHFSCYVNDVLDGTLTDPNKKQGNVSTTYSGIILHGDRQNTNNIDNFEIGIFVDSTPPANITDLAASSSSATTADLTWTAPGDDGNQGTAASYDVRYSTSPITSGSAFNAATQVNGAPAPLPANSTQTMKVSGLAASTTYYFAIKTIDEAGNVAGLSNSASATTAALDGNLVIDDFERETLGSNWVADPSYRIINGELACTPTVQDWDLAVFKVRKNPIEVSFQWGVTADDDGIGQGGFAVMLDNPSITANGYMLWWRTPADEIRLWTISNGEPGQVVDAKPTSLPHPKAGDVVSVAISSDASGHHFALSINGVLDGILSDAAKQQGNGSALYAGVMVTGNLNNHVDNFTIRTVPGKPTSLEIVSGTPQSGVKGTKLASPFVVRLADENGSGVANALIKFTVTQGGGTLDKQQTNDGNIRLEAESGVIAAPMKALNDPQASGGKYILVPLGTPEGAGGNATYSFEIKTPGNYVIWGRKIAATGDEDSFFIIVDGGREITWHLDQSEVWAWDRVSDGATGPDPAVFTLAAGTHTLVVKQRETNVKLDRILITSNLSYVPSGKEEVQGYFTDAQGKTQAYLTLGPTTGTNTVTASYLSLPSVTFTATALPGPPDKIEKVSGDSLKGLPGQPLSKPFVVRIKAGTDPVPNYQVTFVVTEGGGTLSNSQPVTTDINGYASTTLTLGTTSPTNKVEARAPGVPGSPVVFTAFALPGDPKKLLAVDGDLQTGSAGQPLPKPIQVKVTDIIGSPIVSHPVTFTVTTGGGSINGGQTAATVKTNQQGIASVTWTLGILSGATNKLEAASSFGGNPLQNSPLTFTATSAIPASMALVSGNLQTGTINTPLAKPFIVVIKDVSGKTIAGQKVTFTVIEGNGKINGLTSKDVFTTELGEASATLTLGPTPGASNKVRATSSHAGNALAGSPITFTATATLLKQITSLTSNNLKGTVNTALAESLKVKVSDTQDRGVPNYPVTFVINGGGGKLDNNQTTVTKRTNQNGIALASWTLGPLAGQHQATASASYNNQPLSGSPIQFQAQAITSIPAILKIASGDSQKGVVGNQLPDPLKVKVTDAYGNAILNHAVIFVVKAGGGKVNSANRDTVKTNSAGFALATLVLGTTSGLWNNQVEAQASNAGKSLTGSPALFRATATASPARNIGNPIGGNQSGIANSPLPQPLSVTVKDRLGNPVPRHPVTFTVTKGGGGLDTAGVNAIVKLSNDNGIASVRWFLGPVAGQANEVQAAATDGTAPLTGSPIIFTATSKAGPMSSEASKIVASSPVLADGRAKTEITVTITDAAGNPLAGKAVVVKSSDPNDVPEQPLSPTDNKGQVKAYLKSTRAGWKTISARNINDGKDVKNVATVYFIPLEPRTIALHNGNNQTANVGTAVPRPLEVMVKDQNGNPTFNGSVTFRVTEGGGYIVEAQPVLSDSNGIARATWVLGPVPSSNRARAESGLSGSPINFTATGVQASARKLDYVSGNDPLNPPAGMPLPQPVVVRVTDGTGKPVWNFPVAFVVVFDGESAQNDTIVIVKSDYKGEGSVVWTLGRKVGLNFLEARAQGLDGSPITFRANSVPGPQHTMNVYSGNNQSVAVSGTSQSLIAQIVDQVGNAVQGTEVKFQILKGTGASLARLSQVSNASGFASTSLTLGQAIGEYVVEATAERIFGSPIIFSINGIAAAGKLMSIASGNAQKGTINRELPLPLEVKVVDIYGNPKANVPISFVVSQGGGSILETQPARTDQFGIAQAAWKIGSNTALNGNEVTAINRDLPGSPLVFRATGVSNNNYPQFTGVASSYTVREKQLLRFEVKATDDDNDPLAYSTVQKPRGASFGISEGKPQFSWTPDYDQTGTHQVKLKVEDGKGGFDQVNFLITVQNANRAPLVMRHYPVNLDTNITPNATTKYRFWAVAADPDSDKLYYLWTDSFLGPNTAVANTNEYNLQTNVSSPRLITVRVFDLQDTVSVTWRINGTTVKLEVSSFTAQASPFGGIQLTWETRNEADNAGFNILRAPSKSGLYKKLNDVLLPSRPDGKYSFEDKDVLAGIQYYYMIEDVDIHGVSTRHGPVGPVSPTVGQPTKFALNQNYPNPFNPVTHIRYELPKTTRVTLTIYNNLGQEVRKLVDVQQEAGYYVATWNGRDNRGIPVGSGIYYYRLEAGQFSETKKMALLR